MRKNKVATVRKNSRHVSRSRFKKVIVIVFTIFIISVLGVAGYVGYNYWVVQEKLKAQSLKIETEPVIREVDGKVLPEFDGAFSMLIVGSDERDTATPADNTETLLNDVNILVHVAEDHKRISIVSFPRDLMIEMPECDGKKFEGKIQINTALQTGGLSCVVKTIESLTGFEIPYAALVNFQSVVSITDELGGVPLCLATPIRDMNTGQVVIEAGDSVMDGQQALSFVRSRYGIGNGSDLGRINNQQVFIKNVMFKITSDGVLTDPVKTVNVANILLDNVRVSESLADINTLLSLARVVRDIGIENISFYTIPYTSYPANPNRVGFDEVAAKTLLETITAPTAEPLVGVDAVPIPKDPASASTGGELLTVIASPPISKKLILEPLGGAKEFKERTAAGVYCGQGSDY